MLTVLASSPDFLSSLGGIISGLSSLLAVIGGGIGWFVRSRKAKKQERERIEIAARIAKEETQKKLEARLEEQSRDLENQFRAQIDQLRQEKVDQATDYRNQIADLREQNQMLLAQLLETRQGNRLHDG